mmetsp:Transcript_9618/g.23440  ORF Transcript_9618/g.23440 Transcript_9618/m.23440 type:complete len:205 (+) Transcript_9618:2211-2825(+)
MASQCRSPPSRPTPSPRAPTRRSRSASGPQRSSPGGTWSPSRAFKVRRRQTVRSLYQGRTQPSLSALRSGSAPPGRCSSQSPLAWACSTTACRRCPSCCRTGRPCSRARPRLSPPPRAYQSRPWMAPRSPSQPNLCSQNCRSRIRRWSRSAPTSSPYRFRRTRTSRRRRKSRLHNFPWTSPRRPTAPPTPSRVPRVPSRSPTPA